MLLILFGAGEEKCDHSNIIIIIETHFILFRVSGGGWSVSQMSTGQVDCSGSKAAQRNVPLKAWSLVAFTLLF